MYSQTCLIRTYIIRIREKIEVFYGSLDNYIRGTYRKSCATFLACELGTADEGECGGRWN